MRAALASVEASAPRPDPPMLPLPDHGGQVTELVAILPGSPVRGYVRFKQAVTSDGFIGDTVVSLDLQGLGGFPGPLLWHLHDSAISSPSDCASAGGHYDPTL